MLCYKIFFVKKYVDLYLFIRWMVDFICMDVFFVRFFVGNCYKKI